MFTTRTTRSPRYATRFGDPSPSGRLAGTGPARFTVRVCPGEGCGWLFPDAGGRRRWCSLATCGTAEVCGGRADAAPS